MNFITIPSTLDSLISNPKSEEYFIIYENHMKIVISKECMKNKSNLDFVLFFFMSYEKIKLNWKISKEEARLEGKREFNFQFKS